MSIPAEKVLEAARREGAEVSLRQLKRWRSKGLIPRPEWGHERGVAGSRSLYPAWTPFQVVEVWRRGQSMRRTNVLLIGLWWDGWWVDRLALREALCEPFERLSHQARAITAPHENPCDAADALVDVAELDAASAGGTGVVGRRLRNRTDIRTVMHTFFVAGLGVEPEWETQDVGLAKREPSVAELVNRGTGIERAQRDSLGANPPWLPEPPDIRSEFEAMRAAGVIDLLDLAAGIRDASDRQLDDARNAARSVSTVLAPELAALERELGRDIGGLGSIADLASTADQPAQRIWLVRLMVMARRLVPAEVFERMVAMGAPESRPACRCVS